MAEKLWTVGQGRNVYARFGGIEGDQVKFIIGGDVRPVPMASLALGSQQLALKLQSARGGPRRVLGLIPIPKTQAATMASLSLGPYLLRSRADKRKGAIRRMGADPAQIEDAIERSLSWLKVQQNEDGTWGSKGGADQTGLVLQCFLARGESLESTDTSARIIKAVGYLLNAQDKFSNKMFSRDPVDHAEAACALGELYLLAAANGKTVPGLREAIDAGIQPLISGQHKIGGGFFDPTILGFERSKQYPHFRSSIGSGHALSVARDCGVRLGSFGLVVTKLTDYLEKAGARISPGATLVCLRHIAGPSAPPPPKSSLAAQLLESVHYTLKQSTPDFAKADLSLWRDVTETMFLSASWDGGQAWAAYSSQVFPQLLSAQQPDGSFRANDTDAAQDPILRQALCTLMLEVFYRLRTGS